MPYIGRSSIVVLIATTLAFACGRLGYEPIFSPAGPVDAGADAIAPTDVHGSDASDVGGSGGGTGGDVAGGTGGTMSSDGGAGAIAGVGGGTPLGGMGMPPDYCLTVPALPQAANIDGVKDEGVALRTWEPAGWISVGGQALPPDVRARYAVAWRSDGLYVFVEVTTPKVLPPMLVARAWLGDSVEIYVDSNGVFKAAPDYDKTGTRQFIVVAPAPDTSMRHDAAIFDQTAAKGLWTNGQYASYTTPTGYSVEAFIRGADIDVGSWTLAAGQQVGLNLGHNVAKHAGQMNTDDDRIGQYFLRIEGATADRVGPYNNTSTFCLPTLAPL